jgi:hypothetical protein
MPSQKKLSGPCPTFFKAACLTASRDGHGYKGAAKALLPHVSGVALMPDDVETDAEWDSRLKALDTSIGSRDDAAVLGWFDANLPRCMALVPRARRGAFLGGIYEAVFEDGVVIDGVV